MKDETQIKDYESFLKAKEELKTQLHFHKMAIALNIKEGVRAVAVVRLISLAVDKIYKLDFMKNLGNTFFLKTFSQRMLKTWLNSVVLKKAMDFRSFLKFN